MELPRVYANKIDKDINNNASYYRNDSKKSLVDLSGLKKCFDSRGYANRLIVEIETREGRRKERLVLIKNNFFVNIDNKRIYFDEIIDYEIKK